MNGKIRTYENKMFDGFLVSETTTQRRGNVFETVLITI